MVITSSVKCLEHSVCRVMGESISVAHTVYVYVCTFALGVLPAGPIACSPARFGVSDSGRKLEPTVSDGSAERALMS